VRLGLGLTLFTTLAVIETNLSGQIRTTIPAKAPSFFMLDIPSRDVPASVRWPPAPPLGDLGTIPRSAGRSSPSKGSASPR
jgi:putative ABC transport system permease protein